MDVVIVKSYAIDELYQRSKKKGESRNERTVGGSSATSPRRNIAAIIFKQAASGRSIFSSGTRRYSNRRLDRSLGLFLRLREGYFVGNATSHPVPSPAPLSFEPDEPFYSTSPFSLTDFPFDARETSAG